ncbi:MAG: hypothetical protein GY866_27670 [Proteobacteria bacterium]|nr:hypothetical protein [Pseudomonadota bacterium]
MEYFDTILFLLKFLIVGVVLFALLFIVLPPLFKSLTEKPRELRRSGPLPRVKVEEEEELEIPTSSLSEDVSKEKIIKIARQDPLKTTQLVRNWLREKK